MISESKWLARTSGTEAHITLDDTQLQITYTEHRIHAVWTYLSDTTPTQHTDLENILAQPVQCAITINTNHLKQALKQARSFDKTSTLLEFHPAQHTLTLVSHNEHGDCRAGIPAQPIASSRSIRAAIDPKYLWDAIMGLNDEIYLYLTAGVAIIGNLNQWGGRVAIIALQHIEQNRPPTVTGHHAPPPAKKRKSSSSWRRKFKKSPPSNPADAQPYYLTARRISSPFTRGGFIIKARIEVGK